MYEIIKTTALGRDIKSDGADSEENQFRKEIEIERERDRNRETVEKERDRITVTFLRKSGRETLCLYVCVRHYSKIRTPRTNER